MFKEPEDVSPRLIGCYVGQEACPSKKSANDDTIVTEIFSDHESSRRSVPKDACLIVIYGDELGRKYNIVGRELRIGRSDSNDICIPQDSVSREHAMVRTDKAGIFLQDNASTNGTFVNDERVDEACLVDGDLVKIGRSIFKFLSGDNIESSYHEEIFRLSTIDGLTEVYNRRYFSENLERELSRARRYKRPLALLMFDIDHFKRTNDTFGHRAGDFVLQRVADLVSNRARSVDVVARYGGEEFVVILPEIDADGATRFAEDLRTLIADHEFEFEGERIPTEISVGIAVLEDDMEAGDALVERADRRLLLAKERGRNQIVSSDTPAPQP